MEKIKYRIENPKFTPNDKIWVWLSYDMGLHDSDTSNLVFIDRININI